MPRGEEKSSSNGGEEKGLLQRAIKYCWSNNFLDVFRAYFRKHAHHFERIAEEKTEEHDLVFQELFQEYLGIFEGTLEDFIEREGATQEQFYAAIRDAQSSTDPSIQLFIRCLLASADYDSFFNVMVKESRRQLDAQGADEWGEGKAAEGGDGGDDDVEGAAGGEESKRGGGGGSLRK
ncbi:hypothetical protein JKP88DRAFT_295570 [Tribonema minus]|uniref:Cilia- and flagella-associated protein 36 n=1 Tax=Tribonema minus TaxID=303371 RepID=A0A835ZDD4_9STRA|nr:hypothetical protein JKP88DRAFT_295570 [Tribonema minus]